MISHRLFRQSVSVDGRTVDLRHRGRSKGCRVERREHRINFLADRLLDPRTERWLAAFIVSLNKSGKTIITSTHNLELVQEISGRAVLFDETHHVAADLPTEKLLENIDLRGVPDGRYTLAAAPLKISGAEGAPCRAILISNE